MGMFDWVKYKCTCDVCTGKVIDFQSKSGDNVLDLIDPTDVDNF